MEKLALFGSLGLLLAACSCNGQKRVNGPDTTCDTVAISASFDEVYAAIDHAFDTVNVMDCEATGRVANEWLDKYSDKIEQTHQRGGECNVKMSEDAWQASSRIIAVIGPFECGPETQGGAAYQRYNNLIGGRDIPVEP